MEEERKKILCACHGFEFMETAKEMVETIRSFRDKLGGPEEKLWGVGEKESEETYVKLTNNVALLLSGVAETLNEHCGFNIDRANIIAASSDAKDKKFNVAIDRVNNSRSQFFMKCRTLRGEY